MNDENIIDVLGDEASDIDTFEGFSFDSPENFNNSDDTALLLSNNVNTGVMLVESYPDYTPIFSDIYNVVSIILFVILFQYLEKKIKHIVLLFVGKGGKNE